MRGKLVEALEHQVMEVWAGNAPGPNVMHSETALHWYGCQAQGYIRLATARMGAPKFMHEKAKADVEGKVLRYLESCAVVDGNIRSSSDVDAFVALLEIEEKHFNKWLSRFDLVVETALRAGLAVRDLDEDGDGNLRDLLGTEGLKALASGVVEELAGLPHEFEFWVHLRGVRGVDLSDLIQISDTMSLERAHVVESPKGLARSLFESINLNDPPRCRIADGDTVLRVRALGFSRGRLANTAPESAYSTAREFLGLAQAVGIFQNVHSIQARKPTGLLMELPLQDSQSWIEGIPSNVLRYVDQFSLTKAVTHQVQGFFSAKPGEDIELHPNGIRESLSRRLAKFGTVFASEPDSHCSSLRTAARWFFDASAEDNKTNSYIFASLGLEAILGGGEEQQQGVGTMKLLGNRLAYLLGGSREVRKRVVEDFSSFYRIRSGILHGRLDRLTYSNAQLYSNGMSWLRNALRKELDAVCE